MHGRQSCKITAPEHASDRSALVEQRHTERNVQFSDCCYLTCLCFTSVVAVAFIPQIRNVLTSRKTFFIKVAQK